MTDSGHYKIGVDWGSSSFRAYQFNQQFHLIDSVTSASGIKAVPAEQFESTLFELIGHWLQPGTQVLISGMVTSRNGWIETPYIDVPSKLNKLLKHAESRIVRDVELIFLPGLCQTTPRADVIRGEELQLFGATEKMPTASVVMPGTHSKWAKIQDGTVTGFQTIMTGELFDVLLHHTLVGQLATNRQYNETLFTKGVHLGFESTTIISELFQCRSGVLLGELDANTVHSYLSGLLIGNEISEGLTFCKALDTSDAIVIIGSDVLSERYAHALQTLRLNHICSNTETTSNAFAALFATIT